MLMLIVVKIYVLRLRVCWHEHIIIPDTTLKQLFIEVAASSWATPGFLLFLRELVERNFLLVLVAVWTETEPGSGSWCSVKDRHKTYKQLSSGLHEACGRAESLLQKDAEHILMFFRKRHVGWCTSLKSSPFICCVCFTANVYFLFLVVFDVLMVEVFFMLFFFGFSIMAADTA